ncbi:MAG: HAMP domain-containing protein [bacterium]
MFSNNAISIRLFNGYFIIIIFLGIITIVSLVKLGSINYLKKSLVDNYARIEYISNLEINKEKLITKTRMHNIKKGNEQEVAEDCLNILNSMGNEALQLTSICINNPLLLRLSNAIKNHCNILSSEYKAHTYPGNRILLPEINNLGVVISAFKKEGYEDMEWLQGSLKSVIKSALTTLLFFFLITVIYSIFLSINIASSITKPLSKLMDAAKIIRGGNLSVRVNTNTIDEIGTLSMSFNEMVGTLNIDKQKINEYNRNLEAKNLELKNLSHRLFTVQDDERKRLSQVLHEEIGQSMSALKINFKLLEHYNNNNNKSKAVSGSNSEFQSCVEDCRKIVDMAFKSLRSLTFSLKYNILDKMGILEATNYYLEQVSERSAIRIITASNVKEEDVSEHIKMHLFRIICEAITNIIKHANATLIRLDFAQNGNDFVLCISDNGSGFNVKNVLGKSEDAFKMGLTTLRELVHIMRGKLNIISELSKGTSLIIKLPLTKDEIEISGGV